MRYLDKFIETESISRMIVTEGWVEEGEMETCCLMATEFQGVFLKYCYLFNLFIFGCAWVFVAARGLSLVAASKGCSVAEVHQLLL